MSKHHILQLLAHHISHPKVAAFLAQEKLNFIEGTDERGQYQYQNLSKNLVLTFSSCFAADFAKHYLQNVIAPPNKTNKDGPILSKIKFIQGYKKELPFNLSFLMAQTEVSQTLKAEPLEIVMSFNLASYSLDFAGSNFKYHIKPYWLDFVYKDERICWLEITFVDILQIAQFKLQADYLKS